MSKVIFISRVLPEDKKLFYKTIKKLFPHDDVGIAWGKIVKEFVKDKVSLKK